ncbi:gamma-glutamyl-gamma-aminobutyrate hydrolase family protein [Desulfonatronum thiodismutans]|uniref:gamma-glutamyl-gamma-aminobutyrate hydrolase family protein n=1 Tax=Desulfonatronum thiodismutans TaxID=159290 RepID=UPI0004ABD715|nr:gamma-glutamyl-gamma-aminobutyrate hydrolase family protein [Desulfonatronum thiodismutans]
MAEAMNGKKPVIGVTGPDHGGLAAWWFTRLAVWRAGGRALRIIPQRPRHVQELDGLIIGGGADVAPDLYGAEPLRPPEKMAEEMTRGETGWFRRGLALLAFPLMLLIRRILTTRNPGLNTDRDELEQSLLRSALERDLPILGICRGAQLINVTLGGTLHQHLTGFYQESPNIRSLLPRKTIQVEPDSLLARGLKCVICGVNALHDQAVDKLGRTVRVTAREPNGVIQAVEATSKTFVLGVQWHPEYLPHHRRQQRLFRALVQTAQESRRSV